MRSPASNGSPKQRQFWLKGSLIVLTIALLGWRVTLFDRDFRLWAAAFNSNPGQVRVLLSQGANPNASWQGLTALDAACFRKDNASALLLLAHGADWHQGWHDVLGNPRVLRILLARGMPPNGDEAQNLFLRAVSRGDTEDAAILLQAGVDPHSVVPGTKKGAMQLVKECDDPKAREKMKRLLQKAGLF